MTGCAGAHAPTYALYTLHAILGHMPYRRIERMIMKGLYTGYSFDMSLFKQLVNV